MFQHEHTYGEWCYLFGPHLLLTTYRRQFWRPWHKRHIIRCYECNIEIWEP